MNPVGRPSVLIPEGTVIGRLTILGPGTNRGKNRTSRCRCTCGVEKEVLNLCLKAKKPTISCGCYIREITSIRAKTGNIRRVHGGYGTLTYSCWIGMIARCNKPSNMSYPRYGGKGVTVCERWSCSKEGYKNFIKDMGERPSRAHSIDRINGGNYEPGECRWATRSQQNQNVGLKKSNSSGYKGINRHASKWTVEVRNDGSKYYAGIYDTKEEAALAYNIASEKLQGLYGVRNSLPPMDEDVVKSVRKTVMHHINKKLN